MKWLEDLSDWIHKQSHKLGAKCPGRQISWWEGKDYMTGFKCARCGKVFGIIRTIKTTKKRTVQNLDKTFK